MSQQGNPNGSITGVALAAAAHWVRYDTETQRRIRNVSMNADEALDQIHDLQSHGEMVRSHLPTVMDAQVGIAIASPQPASVSVVPSTAPMSRPDLSTQAESGVAELSWPPEPGQYDARGLVKQAGELTSMFLALTFEEVRAFVQGLTQARPPSRDAKVQIFSAAHALVAQLATLRLSAAQYRVAWGRVFGDEAVAQASDPHRDPSRPPLPVGALAANVASVMPLSSASIPGFPFSNRNTDAAMRFRVMTGAAAVPVGQPIATIQFGSEYRVRIADADSATVPTQPVVLVNSAMGRFFADNITSTGFTLVNATTLQAGTGFDVFVGVAE